MKKFFVVFLFLFLFLSNANADYVLYRISSGEVLGYSVGHDFSPVLIDSSFAVDDNATYSDGTEIQDPNGLFRVLGYSKIYDNGVVRNATQNEIDGFNQSEINDNESIDAQKAIQYLNNHPKMKKILVALLTVLIDEQFNPTRAWLNDLREQVAASTSLADFQNRIANLPSWNENVTMGNLKTAVENEIN